MPRVVVRALDRQFEVFARVRDRLEKVHGAHGHEREIGRVRRAGHTRLGRHRRHLERAADAAHIHDVRLDDIDRVHGDHPLPCCQIPVLLATRDVNLQRGGDFGGGVEIPIGDRLLIVADAVILKHMAHFDRPLHVKARVGIDQKIGPPAQSLGHGRDDLFGAARPFVDIVATLGADAEFHRVKALVVAKPQQARGFILRCNVALH